MQVIVKADKIDEGKREEIKAEVKDLLQQGDNKYAISDKLVKEYNIAVSITFSGDNIIISLY